MFALDRRDLDVCPAAREVQRRIKVVIADAIQANRRLAGAKR